MKQLDKYVRMAMKSLNVTEQKLMEMHNVNTHYVQFHEHI
jgi:hypothetical protein